MLAIARLLLASNRSRTLAVLYSVSLAVGCGGVGAAARPPEVVTCANGADSDGNACEARQAVAETKHAAPGAAVTPPALAHLLEPGDGTAGPGAAPEPASEVARLSVERMYKTAWTFQKNDDYERARVIYGDILEYFAGTGRAAYAKFNMGEMYLKEGLAFGSYLTDAADAFAEVANDTNAEPALVAFALMRLEQTCELTGDSTRQAESKARLAREFPGSDAAKALQAKTR
jgi:TolA-binding protein